MIIFMDLGSYIFILLLIFALGAGTVLSIAKWLVDHVILVGVLLLIKAVLIVGVRIGVFKREINGKDRLIGAVAVLVDMVRSCITLWALTDGISTALRGGVFHMLVTGFGLLIGGGALLCAQLLPLSILDEDDCTETLIMELVSLALIVICCLVIYLIFGGW